MIIAKNISHKAIKLNLFQEGERDIKPNTIESRKQNQKLSQKNKKIIKHYTTGAGFGTFK